MNPLYKAWTAREPIKLEGTQYTLQGFSIAGYRTNFYVKELDLMLDAGISANFAPKKILITHCHSDHIANLPFHLYGGLDKQDEEKIQVWMPQETEKLIRDYIDAMFRLSFHVTDVCHENGKFDFYNSVPVIPNQIINFQQKSGKYQIEIFKCDHSVPCVGYGVSEIRKKLKEEYKTTPGKELGALRKSGIQIDEEYIDHQFVFLGDTTWEMFEFEENNNIFKYKNIIVECSFITDDEIVHAIEKRHNHWQNFKPFVVANPQVNFVLIHFSPRYKKKEIEEFFEKENIPNITLWINVE
jgi:ribonuclease Z